mmetsp:Transcript_22119/g.54691  ORF Transcript_22119/g.54691 Transcript_22119/m.54691 type:complete len:220 (+) Transcript_22119:676-1335(+)
MGHGSCQVTGFHFQVSQLVHVGQDGVGVGRIHISLEQVIRQLQLFHVDQRTKLSGKSIGAVQKVVIHQQSLQMSQWHQGIVILFVHENEVFTQNKRGQVLVKNSQLLGNLARQVIARQINLDNVQLFITLNSLPFASMVLGKPLVGLEPSIGLRGLVSGNSVGRVVENGQGKTSHAGGMIHFFIIIMRQPTQSTSLRSVITIVPSQHNGIHVVAIVHLF